MELKIFNGQETIQTVSWNYEELKKDLTIKINEYKSLVYTDDNIKQAKADRAKLNALIKALEDKRVEIKKQFLVPYLEFEQKEKELVEIINSANIKIDAQVKEYEQKLKNAKLVKVQEIYHELIGDLQAILPFERVFKSSYVNASTTYKLIKAEINEFIEKVKADLALINDETNPFVFEMKEIYLKNYNLNEALAVKQRLEETARKKAEFEANKKKQAEIKIVKEKQEAQRIARAGVKSEAPTNIAIESTPVEETEELEESIITIDIRVATTSIKLNLLKDFLKINKIEFGPVPVEGE